MTNLDYIFLNLDSSIAGIPVKDKPIGINIFYHMFCLTDALDRFNNTLIKINKSGLINVINKIYINCVGPEKLLFASEINKIDATKIKVFIGEYAGGESETLNLLRHFSILNPTGKSLYLHSKGVWRNHTKKNRIRGFNRQAVQDWIDCMEYFLIEEFETCLKILNTYDNCGIFYRLNGKKMSMYAGNFWWSNNSYLSTRPRCSSLTRHEAESNFLNPRFSKYKDMYPINYGSLYKSLHPRNLYTNKPKLT